MPFGDRQIVRNSVRKFNGRLLEAFAQGSPSEGMWTAASQIPETQRGMCKSLCLHWVAHHATENPRSFSEYAKQFGSSRAGKRGAGDFTGAGIALNQLNYHRQLRAANSKARSEQVKDEFAESFLEQRGVIRQSSAFDGKVDKGSDGFTLFARKLAFKIVGRHRADYWSYKIISLHGRAGGHAVCAFVGADVVFFDPNYGVFYFEKKESFRAWMADLGGFYYLSGYFQELGADFVIRSYALRA